MPVLENYNEFEGRHPETGVMRNYFASKGVKAPHTGKPYSEALLMGVSGGIVMGYFVFAYKGCDPHVALLTRNTFDPMDRLFTRLGIERDFRRSTQQDKAFSNLIATLEEGQPAMAWADHWSLPYNALSNDDGMWGSHPVIVFGVRSDDDSVLIADRSAVPLTISLEEWKHAFGRIKKDKHQICELDIPNPDLLPDAVRAGLRDSIQLFMEKPPRGTRRNFGWEAFQHWIKMLTFPKQRQSWAKEFPPGNKLYAGLISVLGRGDMLGIRDDSERSLYADFLDEAAEILEVKSIKEVAEQFRVSGDAWHNLTSILLPDRVALLGETRVLMTRRRHAFIERGQEALNEMREIDQRLCEIKEEVGRSFPLNEAEVDELLSAIAEQLKCIGDIEKAAFEQLGACLA